ncbi:rhomboid family intramembrane serine protease [Lacticaseibacillus hulanensis]|uniref:rhomboid family intramembrane serine protease n=1 Tax=Lacticaseibacillus hulanensis TaxID=2493111 RepID=UPI000FDC9BCA|nr:rhomboid family intramembrane serine protease [Lacticaseibacillus hulanensis]
MRRQNFFAGQWVTTVLLGISVFMFVVETLMGGSTSTAVLYDLGARFAPSVVLAHEWWRLLTPIFLHIGITHLVVNMVTLWILGRVTEQAFGHWRFLVIYLVSGITGNFAGLLFGSTSAVAAGASTSLFGLFGAFLMIGDSFRDRPQIAAMTRSVLAVVAVNLVFDLFAGNIDIAGHLGGLIGGFLIAGVVGVPLIGELSKTRRIIMGVLLVVAPVLLGAIYGGNLL